MPSLPFGIYLHLPFCVHRCSYCDFYSSTRYNSQAFERLSDKIAWEAREAARWLSAKGSLPTVTSIFLGGGTPSLLPMKHLESLFGALLENFPLAEDAEITLEANPETVTQEFAHSLVARTPVNRVSLGAQSFEAEHLATLERLGSAESVERAVELLKRAGVNRFSLDLIFGIPGQTPAQVVSDIDRALSLGPSHLSFYSLTLKPGHRLYAGLPDDDKMADLYEQGRQRLEARGFEAYEISNFSLPGFESQHNLLYWSGGDFLGLGPSSASRFFWEGSFHHRKQVSSWEQYLDVSAFPSPEFVANTSAQTVLEATFLELRKRSGIDRTFFKERYRYDLGEARNYPLYLAEGLLEESRGYIRLTRKGWLLAEGIAERLSLGHDPRPSH